MKTKMHEFKLMVQSGFSRRETWLALLSVLAGRDPDGCRVSLRLAGRTGKCPACGVSWAHHLGAVNTCHSLKLALSVFEQIGNIPRAGRAGRLARGARAMIASNKAEAEKRMKNFGGVGR